MTEHVTPEMYERLQRRELAPPELLSVLRHIGQCDVCISREASRMGELRDALVSPHAAADPRRFSWVAVAVAAAALLFVLFVDREPPATTKPVAVAPAVATAPPTSTTESFSYGNGEWDRLVADARKQNRLPFADLAELNPRADVLRGANDDGSAALFPAGVVIDDTRPSFRWPATQNATYVVAVFAGEEEIARSEPLDKARWTPPRALRRDRVYTWHVEVTRDEDIAIIPAAPAPPAMFRVLSAERHRELRAAIEQFPNDSFLHAVLYARAGLRREAEAALAHAE